MLAWMLRRSDTCADQGQEDRDPGDGEHRDRRERRRAHPWRRHDRDEREERRRERADRRRQDEVHQRRPSRGRASRPSATSTNPSTTPTIATNRRRKPGSRHGDLGDAGHGDEDADDLEGFGAGGDEPTARAVDVEHLLVHEGEERGDPEERDRRGRAPRTRSAGWCAPGRAPSSSTTRPRARRRPARSPRRGRPPSARGSPAPARGGAATSATNTRVGMAKRKNGHARPSHAAITPPSSGPRICPTEFACRCAENTFTLAAGS